MEASVYLPTVAWRTYAKDVILLTEETTLSPAIYRISVQPIDVNELGAATAEKQIGFYFKDYVGHTYTIVDFTTTTIDVSDDFRCGVGAQSGRQGVVYKSVGNGLSPYLAPIYYRHLDRSALEYSRQTELDILWKHRLFTYTAFASDNIGTDFTLTNNSALPYMAILVSPIEIETPIVGDFVGLWRSGGSNIEPPLVAEYQDFIAGTVKDYVLLLSAIYPFSIDSFWAEVDDGTIDVSLKIGSTAITGIDGMTIDTIASQIDATALNSVAIGDRVIFSISATYTGAPTLIRIQIKTTRL